MGTMAASETLKLNEGMEAGIRIEVSKVIRAKRERVFEAWTKPEVIRQWFGPEGRRAREVKSDLRVGGAWSIDMDAAGTGSCAGAGGERAEGRAPGASGVYREIVPNELLSFTWRGNWVPDEETLVTVRLKDVDGGTEVVIVHERFLTDQSARGHEQGWVGSLGKLARMLEG